MKIIKSGKKEFSHGWKKKRDKGELFKVVTCQDNKFPIMDRAEGCRAVLEISENDLIHLFWRGTHFPHSYPGFECANCGKINHAGKMPDIIWQKVKKKKAKFDGFSEEI